jgi:hypothetical protein
MKPKPPSVDAYAYSVLKLSVTRLKHIREVQAMGGGHFVQVARELGYIGKEESVPDDDELEWLEAQLAQAEQLRKKRSDALIERLNSARERLSVRSDAGTLPPPPDDEE